MTTIKELLIQREELKKETPKKEIDKKVREIFTAKFNENLIQNATAKIKNIIKEV